MKSIIDYISSNPRNKLVVSNDYIPNCHYVDVGYEMCRFIKDDVSSSNIGLIAEDVLRGLFDRNVSYDNQLGAYVAIKNIGILYEADLRLDVKSILESSSKEHLTILKFDGEFKDGKLYFLTEQDKLSIDLSDLSYLSMFNQ